MFLQFYSSNYSRYQLSVLQKLTYVAVIAGKHPKKVCDLMGYQALILEANVAYEEGTWLGYDRRFRLSVAGNPDAVWAHIALWNKAFTGHAKAKRCRYCFSLTHDVDYQVSLIAICPHHGHNPGSGRAVEFTG